MTSFLSMKTLHRAKLKQINYLEYHQDIEIFHFQGRFESIRWFQRSLTRQHDGYVDTLLGINPTWQTRNPRPDGDETPHDCTEVAYTPNIFEDGGSALGFCMDDGTVHWMCFDRPTKSTVLNKDTLGKDAKGSTNLFDFVAITSRGFVEHAQNRTSRDLTPTSTSHTSQARGAVNREHKGWHRSLEQATARPVKLKLTWKNVMRDLQEDERQKRAALVHEDHANTGEEISESTNTERITIMHDEEHVLPQSSIRKTFKPTFRPHLFLAAKLKSHTRLQIK